MGGWRLEREWDGGSGILGRFGHADRRALIGLIFLYYSLRGRSAGHPENQERDPLGSASDLPPAYGILAGGRKRLGC
jgi:hypothetical protein